MTNSEIFMIVGQWLTDFLLSLANVKSSDIEPKLHWILSFIGAIVIWLQLLKIIIAIIRKATGFETRPHQ